MIALPPVLSGAAKPLWAYDSTGSSGPFTPSRFVLEDLLDHPFYWWPRTLLSYPIQFHAAVELDRLTLTRTDSSKSLPFQFSNVVRDSTGVRSATLHFFSDLPSGARREFSLTATATPTDVQAQITERQEDSTILLDSGAVRVRIPATQIVQGIAPGPILQLSRKGNDDRWLGASTLSLETETITRIVTTRRETGPLFIVYEIAYETASGSRYVATVHCIAGLDFIRLEEDMEALPEGVRGVFTSTWTDFAVTHRQAPNHPFPLPDAVAPYDDYAWERIDEPFPLRPEVLPGGELPFMLGVYEREPANFVSGTFANFWASKTSDALGLFIDKVEQWQDHEYAYEIESPALQVRFFYQQGRLVWRWPIRRGSRSTCIALYDHAKDKEAMQQLERDFGSVQQNGLTYRIPLTFTSHTLFLQNRYGTIPLDRVKDWVLDYPATARQPGVLFATGSFKDAAELERRIMTSPYVCTLPTSGTRQMSGHGPIPGRSIVNFSPVPSRQILGGWIDGYNRLRAQMTAEQHQRLTAIFLFIAYIHAADEFMPLVAMLSGHPNFLADVKANPPAMSFLFPEHPLSAAWAGMWQRCVELNTRYNTRPEVHTWDAAGGRWTENLGTYVWAFLRPSLRTEFLLRQYDGRERFLSPQIAQLAGWLVGSLSAPFDGEAPEAFARLHALDGGHEWGVVRPGAPPRRVHPPQGAHSERRIPPRSLWYLGARLQRYAPLAAEYAMWAARPTNQDMETDLGAPNAWDVMYREPDNPGTNPRLRSRKFTGYGIVLRAAVDTPNELSIHLQQIDEGPNYRWGVAGEGGCGVLYFFAAGKAYSSNGAEDVGDREDADTDFCTNFGVFKDGHFRSIGMNVLSRPFYNLGGGQFAEIVPRQSPRPYSTPEYVSRSILLAGHDYFVLYDAVMNETIVHRLSWFVRRGDKLPAIHLVRGHEGDREAQTTEMQTAATTGVWYDGVGDSMAVVSHRTDLIVEAKPFGCQVHGAGVDDLVFLNPAGTHFEDGATIFDGTSGLIRRSAEGQEFALFHGTRISVAGITFTTPQTDLGIGGSIRPGQSPRGVYFAPQPSSITIVSPTLSAQSTLYIDGAAQTAMRQADTITIELPQGSHVWELSERLPFPIAPSIERTENHRAGARVIVNPVASANQYRLELSADNGSTWKAVKQQADPAIDIGSLEDGQKVHLRVFALNAAHESQPGQEYPLYVTAQPPEPPAGLHVELSEGAAALTWGEVLGVAQYKLYVRAEGTERWRLLYSGLDRAFTHRDPSIQACDQIPENASAPAGNTFEYCVTSNNANGEGARSSVADTDPGSWLNWDPKPGERFRRVTSYAPGSPPSPGYPPRYYPL